ncbi:MAG: ankyrin repeat domain-containing protein [Rhodospirillaceae bacterium]|nr:ankyrin repeat domain-containing protein [Rhodospirillaceae bacterium]
MWLASAYSDRDMVRLLLKHGADPGALPVEPSK